MRGLILNLKNSFRNSLKNKFQLVGLTLLVALLALVLSLMASINVRVIQNYTYLKSASNARNVVLQMDPTDTVETGDTPNSPAPRNLVEAQQYWLTSLQRQYLSSALQFNWSRTEAREFSQVINDHSNLTIKTVAKFTPNNSINKTPVDQLVIFKGHNIESDRQVVLDSVFAEKHNLKIGSIIRIQKDNLGDQLLVNSQDNKNLDEVLTNDVLMMETQGLEDPNGIYQQKYSGNYDWYQIVGYGGSSDFMMPIFNASTVIPNRNTELLIYVNPAEFGLKVDSSSSDSLYEYDSSVGNLTATSGNEQEAFYSLKMANNRVPSAAEMRQMNLDFIKILKREMTVDKTYFYSSKDPNYRYASRTLSIDKTISVYNISSSILEILLAIVVFYTIALVTKKQVEKTRGQIGTLKASGYYKRELILNFVTTPFFTAVIGGIVGFVLAGGLSQVIINLFSEYFLLNYGVAKFDWTGFFLTIILLWVFLTLIAFLIALLIFKKDTLSLINASRTVKISKLDLFFKQKRTNAKIGSKISNALLIDAKGKMSVVGIVVLIATMMFTISFAAPDILRRNQTQAYTGVKYKQIVEYSDPVYNNPLSFYKTYNNKAVNENSSIFNYSSLLNGFTSLPENEAQTGYDVEKIMEDYYLNNINNEFFSLFIPNNGTESAPTPNLITANQRFLEGKDIASSTDYYHFMAQYGIKIASDSSPIDQLALPILLNQWPDYNELMSNLDDESKTLVDNFNTWQKFYSKYVNSIGLSITHDYYQVDPTTASTAEKIADFNQLNKIVENGQTRVKDIFATIISEQTNNFNSLLKSLTVSDQEAFGFTDANSSLGEFHIQDNNHNLQGTSSDYFLTLKGQDLFDQDPEHKEFNHDLIMFMLWFGTLFSNRADEGIIQAGYTRSPYFVQQFLKTAYVEQEKPYVQSFGVVSYNNQLEQIGTRLNVKDDHNNDFKIYGIQGDMDQFLELKNHQHADLIADLENSVDSNGIVINKSMAKMLKLKTGDHVNLKVIQDQLREKNTTTSEAISLDNWTITPKRNEISSTDTGFMQLNRLQNNNQIVLKTPLSNKSLRPEASLLSANKPSSLYQEVLNGNLLNDSLSTPVDFKVIGIHEGYGTPTAWIKETDAQEILKFDQVKKIFWNSWFTQQWGDEFNQDHSSLNFNKIVGADFSTLPDYDTFINQYLNSADSATSNSAKIILQIFNNAFPVFNYKYSNKDDVGDLSSLVAIHQKFGDYSPIGMQGIRANGRDIPTTYEGVGTGAIGTITPIAISKAILDKISNLVIFVLILAIVAILLITFVIIFLTTSLVINDNIKFIATMKVLGYTNRYIATKVLGMYFIVIGSVFVLGFIGGWFILALIVHALISSIVLPLVFPIWLIFAVLIGVGGIYAITISVGFSYIAKSNATRILQNTDI